MPVVSALVVALDHCGLCWDDCLEVRSDEGLVRVEVRCADAVVQGKFLDESEVLRGTVEVREAVGPELGPIHDSRFG